MSFLTNPRKPLKRSGFKKKVLNPNFKTKQGLKAKNKPLKPKSKPLSTLKKKLDTVFSQYIRQKYANKDGMVACYTCGLVKHWKEHQCGHFEKRHHLSTRWLEENCRVQCVGCNVFRDGNYPEFAYRLEQEKQGTISYLHNKKNEVFRISRQDYERLIEYYENQLSTV